MCQALTLSFLEVSNTFKTTHFVIITASTHKQSLALDHAAFKLLTSKNMCIYILPILPTFASNTPCTPGPRNGSMTWLCGSSDLYSSELSESPSGDYFCKSMMTKVWFQDSPDAKDRNVAMEMCAGA